MNTNILQKIKMRYETMSQVEQKIADRIIADPQKFTTYSLSELAELAQVSQGSIINFANKFGRGGFPSLKLEVAAAIAQEQNKTFMRTRADDSLSETMRDTASDISDALSNTIEANSEDALCRAANMILAAKKVEIYGVFRSAAVATDFYYQLLQIGINATFVGDVLTCAVSASMLDKSDLVIAISSLGQTPEIINSTTLAKKNQVPVISITSSVDSPLSSISDVTLISAPSGNSLTSKSSEIRLSQLAITDALCTYLRSKLDADGRNSYFKMKELLKLLNIKDI